MTNTEELFYGCEEERLRFLVSRDGIDKTKLWALRTLRIYRSAVRKNGKDGSTPHFASYREYRRKFIASYLHFKRVYFND